MRGSNDGWTGADEKKFQEVQTGIRKALETAKASIAQIDRFLEEQDAFFKSAGIHLEDLQKASMMTPADLTTKERDLFYLLEKEFNEALRAPEHSLRDEDKNAAKPSIPKPMMRRRNIKRI